MRRWSTRFYFALATWWVIWGALTLHDAASKKHPDPFMVTLAMIEMFGGPIYALLLAGHLRRSRHWKNEIDRMKKDNTYLRDQMVVWMRRAALDMTSLDTTDQALIAQARAIIVNNPPTFEEDVS